MDFTQAIHAHVQWKQKLTQYIANPDKSLNSSTVSGDQNCELGKWLHSEGRKFSSSSEFSTLVTDHARFHRAAGDVIKNADAGKNVSQDIQLGADSEFARASTAVITKLMALKSKAI
jgi:hypothetical protein